MKKVIENYEMEYEQLKGKRLLILGGMRMACDIVKRAQNMGVYVVVADNTIGAPAKAIADKEIYADVTNVDEIVKICKEEKIDGITTGFVDILLQPCHDACERLGMPYYADNLLIKMSTDKNVYKENCRKYGVPVPEDYYLTDINNKEQMERIKYPVFIKPADNSGSRGAYVCKSENDMIENWPKAFSFSPSGTVITEQFLTGQDIILDYLIKDGEAHLMSIFDRKFGEDRRVAVNHANLLYAPSESTDAFLKDVDPNIKRMCSDLGFKDGLIFFQGYVEKGVVTLFEMGCRLGGTFSHIVEPFLGVNPIDTLINYALTGRMTNTGNFDYITPKYSGAGSVLNLLLREDVTKVENVEGIEEITSDGNIKNFIQFYKAGDAVPQNNATDRPFAIIYLAADSKEELNNSIRNIYNKLKVIDVEGNSALMPVFPI